jgi:hypothetical protein
VADDDKTKDKIAKLEDWLAPWEVDAEGKKLDEPAEIDAAKLKKYLHGVLTDKERLQETVADKEAEVAQAKEQLAEAQRANENEEQRRAREADEAKAATERENAALREKAEGADRLAIALAVPGISAARAAVLAKRLVGKDEKAWKASAEEIIEDGFRLVAKGESTETVGGEGVTESGSTDDLTALPQARRQGGTPPPQPKDSKTDLDRLNEAIPRRGW